MNRRGFEEIIRCGLGAAGGTGGGEGVEHRAGAQPAVECHGREDVGMNINNGSEQ
jgi:hypothetical protein